MHIHEDFAYGTIAVLTGTNEDGLPANTRFLGKPFAFVRQFLTLYNIESWRLNTVSFDSLIMALAASSTISGVISAILMLAFFAQYFFYCINFLVFLILFLVSFCWKRL